jgi:hypothetical protein
MAMTPQYMRELLISTGARYEPPTPEDLAEAPLLDGWSLLDADDEDDLPAVVGIVSGHPYDFVADGSLHVGAEAFAMDAQMTWVRTLSRLYRLGTSAEGSDDT